MILGMIKVEAKIEIIRLLRAMNHPEYLLPYNTTKMNGHDALNYKI